MAAHISTAHSALVHAVSLPSAAIVTVRPAGPQDADVIQSYIRELSPTSRRNRFLGTLKELSPKELYRMTLIAAASS